MQTLDVLVIGAGQAGLAIGHYLADVGLSFAIADGATRVGDSWRHRYDSLRLVTPAQHSGLPTQPFPAARDTYPTKDDVAAYLEEYARARALPCLLATRVNQLRRDGVAFLAATSNGELRARQVVVATGAYQTPIVPRFAAALAPSVVQRHAARYRNPRDLPEGRIVVVGGGLSGLQIAEELAHERDVTLSRGESRFVLPQRALGRSLGDWFARFGIYDVPTRSTLGRVMRGHELVVDTGGGALFRKKPYRVRGRCVGASDRQLQFADGTSLRVDGVVWATGYRHDFTWLDPAALDAAGTPRHTDGVSPIPGIYYLGLPWLARCGSSLLGGVGSDASVLAARILARHERRPSPAA